MDPRRSQTEYANPLGIHEADMVPRASFVIPTRSNKTPSTGQKWTNIWGPTYTNAKRCNFCKELFSVSTSDTSTDEVTGLRRLQRYYPSFAALERGAAEGCELCRLFRQAFLYQSSTVDDEEALQASRWPIKVNISLGSGAAGNVYLSIQNPALAYQGPSTTLASVSFAVLDESLDAGLLCGRLGREDKKYLTHIVRDILKTVS